MTIYIVGSRSNAGNLFLFGIALMLYIRVDRGYGRGCVMKSIFQKFQSQFGEGTAFDLDYGKLIILGLLIYLAFFKEYGS